MTEYIGDVPITSIQNVSVSKSKDKDEINLVDENRNILLEGAESSEEIEIDFTLLKQVHPENKSAEKQKGEVKNLASNDVSDNFFEYSGNEYFLSIGEVSIPDDSTMDTIREGTISATAYPWPQNFPQGERGHNKLSSGELYISFDVESEPSVVSSSVQGEVNYSLNLDSVSNIFNSVLSELLLSFDIESEPSKLKSSSGDINTGLAFDDIVTDLQESSVGFTEFSLEVESSPSKLKNSESTVDYSVDVIGDINVDLNSLFGRRFGRSFGGN